MPLILSFQTLQLADTYLVAGFADLHSAGLYNVAKKVTQPVTYGTSVFQQAWGPLGRDLTKVAVDREDQDLAITARLVTYYSVFVFSLMLGIALFADQIVRLASPEYSTASLLVPVTALSIAGHGGFVLAYRISKLSNRFYWVNLLSSIAAPVFVAVGTFLIIPLGAIGAPIAAVIAWTLATAAMVLISQSKAQNVPFERLRLAEIMLSAALIWVVGYYAVPNSPLGVGLKALMFFGWLSLVVARGVVPLDDVRSIFRYARDTSASESKRQLRRRLAQLDGRNAELVQELIVKGVSLDEVSRVAGLSKEEVLALTIHALRTAAIGGDPQQTDVELGQAILIPRPTAERDHMVMELVGNGADPVETDLIVRAMNAVRSKRRGRRGAPESAKQVQGEPQP